MANHDPNLIMKERDLLKTELQSLKQCQVGYFGLSITATGAILGLSEKANTGLIYVVPLLMILPFWMIFFDKAATISRIVGYSRILERILAGDTKLRYVGWENALRLFRKREAKHRPKTWQDDHRQMLQNAWRSCGLLLDFRREHRYWAINYITFFCLGAFCIALACLKAGQSRWLLLVFIPAFIHAAIHNGDVLWTLVKGGASYDRRERMWRALLRDPKTSTDSATQLQAGAPPAA